MSPSMRIFIKNLLDEMIFALNMLFVLTTFRFFGIYNYTTIITKKEAIGKCIFKTTSISIRNFLSHTTSFVVLHATTTQLPLWSQQYNFV